MRTDLHKKTGCTGAPRLRLNKKVRGESGKDSVDPHYMPPKRWFLTSMCMNIPIVGRVHLICLAFGKKENQLQDFAKAYLIYKLVFLAVVLIILGVLVYIGLDLADKLPAYMEMPQVYLSDKGKTERFFLNF